MPPSTIAYYRWYWDELEPQEGQFNWSMVDSGLALARQETDWNVLTCLPGTHHFSASLALPADAAPGRYSIYFALVDPYTSVPAVRLAVGGRDAQGWYSWSAFGIVGKGRLEETLTKVQ